MILHTKRPILYVDDTTEQRYAMRRILETEGFLVLEAGTGKEALSLVEQPLALAVVDVKLPDISGYDLSRKIKERKPYLPILQVSASFRDPDLRASGLSGGADAYIAQPVHPTEFVALLGRMLQTSEAEESLRFLAEIGPKISASLSLDETANNICEAIVPNFADRCSIYLRGFLGRPPRFWPEGIIEDSPYRVQLESQAVEKSVTRISRHRLVAPLSTADSGFGAISFELKEREYTNTDQVLAANLANRIGLALQNCILYSAEQSTREALIGAEKLATAGRMSAAIAHEINNPLEALTNLLYIIEQSPEASPQIQGFASAALAEITRLAHITRQSLGFYRELRSPSVIDLSQCITDTLELYQKRVSANGIEVKLDLEKSVPISGIKGEIRQVISNLLVNALEAVETGGTVSIVTSNRKDRAFFSIHDNGPGIDAEIQPKIFDPFFTTKKGTGTGLGLWITQAIIHKHGGNIELSSSNGSNHGTTFIVDFPVAN